MCTLLASLPILFPWSPCQWFLASHPSSDVAHLRAPHDGRMATSKNALEINSQWCDKEGVRARQKSYAMRQAAG